jgi:putative copper resistance protein D
MSDWLAIAVRFALYVDLMTLFGLAAFVRLSLRASERGWALPVPLRPAIAVLCGLGLALSALDLLVLTAGMSGVALRDLEMASIKMVLLETPSGISWIARIAALAIALTLVVPSRTSWSVSTIVSGAALGTLAWSGHGAMDEGNPGMIHLAADILHLLSAAAWLGALAGLLLLLWGSSRNDERLPLTYRALADFSSVGTFLVGMVVLTGLANLWFTVGLAKAEALLSTLYGQLLLAKLALFGLMLSLAALNRFRLTPELAGALESGDSGASRRALRGSIAAETGSAVVILAAVAWLGTLAPPI